jgi:predicted RNA-binding protein YlxR (DUF448 family)
MPRVCAGWLCSNHRGASVAHDRNCYTDSLTRQVLSKAMVISVRTTQYHHLRSGTLTGLC